jgi:Tol biopolymer transport system component
MRPWAWLVAAGTGAALAMALVHCSSDGSATSEGDLPLPDRADPGDAATSDAPVDASPTGPRCDPNKPFGTPFPVAEFPATTTRTTPRLSADELTIYFTTNNADAGTDLSAAARTGTSLAFGPEKILAQSTASNDNDPSVTVDQLSLFFHSNRNPGSTDLFVATRTSTSVPFGAAVPIAPIDQPTTNEAHAYFRSAAGELWFVSDRDGGAGAFDIYVSKRATDGGFAAPRRVTELSSSAQDWQPQPSEDGLTILFASDRDGGSGKMDLWIARRADAAAPFGPPAPLTELNSPNVEQAGWLSADGCRIWFSSGRGTADARHQIFHAERPL